MITACKYDIFGGTCVQTTVFLINIFYLLLLFILILCYFNIFS